MKKKRLLGILLSLVMVIGLLPTTAMADESTPGSSASNPVVCTKYADFKAAMEDSNISYVEIKKMSAALPNSDDSVEQVGTYVRGPKHLIITEDSMLYAPMGGSPYRCLINIEAGQKLTISGTGSLTFKANTNHSTNALIENHGECTVESGVTLIGSYNTAVYGYAIVNIGELSNLTINGGKFYGETTMEGSYPFGAVWIANEGKATINGGYFEGKVADGVTFTGRGSNHALIVNNDADCKITSEATFVNGIIINKPEIDAPFTKKLSDFLAEDLCMVAKDSSGYYSPASNATRGDDTIWVVPKPTLESVTVNGEAVADYGNLVEGYGETTVKANEKTTVTATFAIPDWVNDNDLPIFAPLLQVGPDGGTDADVVEGKLKKSEDGSTATATVTFTPETGKTYTMLCGLGIGDEDEYFTVVPANLKLNVEVPPEKLSGKVTYSGTARYGVELTAEVSGAPDDVTESDLNYQWQRKVTREGEIGPTWMSIRGETDKTYTPDKKMIGETIRVKVTADGRDGVIYGAAKEVEKAFAYGTPAAPELSCEGTTITIDNYDSDQEYCYTTIRPGTNVSWPAGGAGTEIEDDSFEGEVGETYYVYTRIAKTSTTFAGTTVLVGSITVPTIDEENEDVSADALIYPDYPGTPTVYVAQGDTVTVRYQITPANANQNLPTWKERSIGGENYPYLTVETNGQNTTSGIGTITIKGDEITSSNGVPVTPYKNEYEVWGTGNDITVVVYDPDDTSTIPFEYVDLGTVELYEGDSYLFGKDDLLSLPFAPVAVDMSKYTLKAGILTSTYSHEEENDNLSVSTTDDGVQLIAKEHASKEFTVDVYALPDGIEDYNNTYRIASFKVTVKEASAVELEGITVNPTALTLEVDEEKTLTATKNPINAAGDKEITWESDNTSIATVDSNGKVTGVAEGTATITATCDGKTASCTVTVVEKNHTHNFTSWTYQDEFFHKGACACGLTAVGKHHWNWVVDTEATADAPGEMHEECKECKKKRNENTDIPKLTFTVTMIDGGTGAAGAGSYNKGDTVTINAGTKTGYIFNGWTSEDGVVFLNANNTSTSFTMPDKAVTVTANWVVDSTAPTPIPVTEANFTLDTSTYAVGKKIVDIKVTPDTDTAKALQWEDYYTSYAILEGDSDDNIIEPASVKTFAANTDYYLLIELVAKDGYTLDGLTKDKIKLNGKAIVSTIGRVLWFKLDQLTGSETPTPEAKYNVTVNVNNSAYGTASATPNTDVKAGTEVTLSAAANSGYHFKEWQIEPNTVTITDNAFTMPEGNVTVTAIFAKNSTGGGGGGGGSSQKHAYAITIKDTENGKVTADHKSASEGTTITLNVDPDKDYKLEKITVLDKNDKEIKLTAKDSKYTFKMPASDITVETVFTKDDTTSKDETPKDDATSNVFVDVPADAYYSNAVKWAAENGITGGVDAQHFAPDATCTRAQAVSFLWRAVGSPAPKSAAMPFADVPADSYYYNAVLWAVENGIAKGTSETTFSPDMKCSRAQIVSFLWRSQNSPMMTDADNHFADVAADAYYYNAVLWAAANGITGGTTATTFSPNNDCTRAQIVTFIWKALTK